MYRDFRDKIESFKREFLGEGSKQSHISKIQKRAEYLENNLEYVRGLLKWPESSCQNLPQILNFSVHDKNR